MPVDQTPPPASIDFEPPAYSQPTLPPPADEPKAPSISRWGARIVGGGLLAVGVAAVAAWSLLPHDESLAHAATASIAHVSKTTVDLGALVKAFPAEVGETACLDSVEHTPTVLYSSIGGDPTSLERELFAGATVVNGPTLTITGRRIAIVRTFDNHEPEPSATTDSAGHYQGALVVFDAVTKQPICQTHLDAVSTQDLRWANVSTEALHKDYVDSVHQALAKSAARLHVDVGL